MKVLNIIYKSYLKMDGKIKYQTKTIRLLEENIRVSLHGLDLTVLIMQCEGKINKYTNAHLQIAIA